jgi:hypothetical protein
MNKLYSEQKYAEVREAILKNYGEEMQMYAVMDIIKQIYVDGGNFGTTAQRSLCRSNGCEMLNNCDECDNKLGGIK